MIDQITEVDPFAPGVLDRETELAALVHALEFASGFSLLFGHCNQAPQRRQLMAEIRARLPRFNIQEIHFTEPVHHLLDALRERLADPLPDAVFISGMEHSLPSLADAPTTPFIANLNASRNSFPSVVPRPLVLWMPEYVLTAIAQGAPDFFSIRSGIYAFAATPEELAGFAHTLSVGEHWRAQSLPLAEKRDRTAAIERLLAEYETLPVDRRDRRAELRLLDHLGVLLYAQGNYTESLRQFQRSLKLTEELGDYAELAHSLHPLGMLHEARGEYGEALQRYEQSLRIAEEIGDRAGIASSLHQLGLLHQERGEYGEALQHYEQSLRIKEEIGDRVGVANSLGQIGKLHTETGGYEEAFALLLNALAAFLQLQSPNVGIVANMLRTLRKQWGEQAFDAMWRAGSGGDVPEWLQQASGAVT
jgi:tetratricopeptide (TPR) repeat protein